jgi:hypothetical protein
MLYFPTNSLEMGIYPNAEGRTNCEVMLSFVSLLVFDLTSIMLFNISVRISFPFMNLLNPFVSADDNW